MMKPFLVARFLLAALLFSGSVSTTFADTLIVPVGQQAEELSSVSRPTTGTTRDKVLRDYGEPLVRNAPTGNPPISSWEYTDFVVYFERDHVIHTVMKHSPYVD